MNLLVVLQYSSRRISAAVFVIYEFSRCCRCCFSVLCFPFLPFFLFFFLFPSLLFPLLLLLLFFFLSPLCCLLPSVLLTPSSHTTL